MDEALIEWMMLVENECEDDDKSTEYTMARLEDVVRQWNEAMRATLDPYETMMAFLNGDSLGYWPETGEPKEINSRGTGEE